MYAVIVRNDRRAGVPLEVRDKDVYRVEKLFDDLDEAENYAFRLHDCIFDVLQDYPDEKGLIPDFEVGPLRHAKSESGTRLYLGDEPLYCGTLVELLLEDDNDLCHWRPFRVEASHEPSETRPGPEGWYLLGRFTRERLEKKPYRDDCPERDISLDTQAIHNDGRKRPPGERPMAFRSHQSRCMSSNNISNRQALQIFRAKVTRFSDTVSLVRQNVLKKISNLTTVAEMLSFTSMHSRNDFKNRLRNTLLQIK